MKVAVASPVWTILCSTLWAIEPSDQGGKPRDPESFRVKTASGGVIGDRIVLESTADDGSRDRWSFNEITRNSFVWRGEKSRDSGKTWQLWAEHHLKRSGTTKNKS